MVKDSLKFQDLRRLTKQMIIIKKKEHARKLRQSLIDTPKRFWSFVKSATNQNNSPNFLREGQTFITDSCKKANTLNRFFHSVFGSSTSSTSNVVPPLISSKLLTSIHLSVTEVLKVLENLDPQKACGPDGFPAMLLKTTA